MTEKKIDLEYIKEKIKILIKEILEIDIELEDIQTDKPIFQDYFGMDSISGIEFVLAIEKTFCVDLDDNFELLDCIDILANFIHSEISKKDSKPK